MKIIGKMSCTLCLLVILVSNVSAKVNPVLLNPQSPTVSDDIKIGVYQAPFFNCIQLPAKNPQGITHKITVQGNKIKLIVISQKVLLPLTCPPVYTDPSNPPNTSYNLGKLAEGTYQLEVYHVNRTETLPTTPDKEKLVSSDIVVNVKANSKGVITSKPVPSLSIYTISILLLLITAFSLKSLRKK